MERRFQEGDWRKPARWPAPAGKHSHERRTARSFRSRRSSRIGPYLRRDSSRARNPSVPLRLLRPSDGGLRWDNDRRRSIRRWLWREPKRPGLAAKQPRRGKPATTAGGSRANCRNGGRTSLRPSVLSIIRRIRQPVILGEIGEVVRIRRRWPAQGVLPVRTTVKPRSMKSGYNQRLDRVAIAILPGQEAKEGGLA
jgi:hypothetical protein